MKKRYFRKEVEYLLGCILMTMFIFTCMVNDFELSFRFLAFAIIWFVMMFILYHLLRKYGRGRFFERD